MKSYAQKISLRWADLDPNGHVRHSVYYDYGAQARTDWLEEQGVGVGWMAQQGFGPVLFREEARFMRELNVGDDISIDIRICGLSADRRKWSIRHRIFRGEELCAVLELDGAWLDLRKRRIVPPPKALLERFEALERTEDFCEAVSGSEKGCR